MERVDAADAYRVHAETFWAADAVGKSFGIEVLSVAPGAATLRMAVTAQMINSHNICHGAFIFALADSAFAVACNTYQALSVGQYCTITYVNKCELGGQLIAVAREINRKSRSGIYDVSISTEQGETVALFRGHSRVFSSQAST
jgi:acyl-CoA thioesterase